MEFFEAKIGHTSIDLPLVSKIHILIGFDEHFAILHISEYAKNWPNSHSSISFSIASRRKALNDLESLDFLRNNGVNCIHFGRNVFDLRESELGVLFAVSQNLTNYCAKTVPGLKPIFCSLTLGDEGCHINFRKFGGGHATASG